MPLKIKPKNDKKIVIYGSDFELPEVLGKVYFVSHDDGKTMDIAVNIYMNEASAALQRLLSTNLEIIVLPRIEIQTNLGETQGPDTALNYAKLYIEQLGYEVEIT